MQNRPDDLKYEKHSEYRPQRQTRQDTNYAQHNSTPPAEDNPNQNPSKDPFSLLHAQVVNREHLLKNIDRLNKKELVRLSRSSYLKHANRYNIRNA